MSGEGKAAATFVDLVHLPNLINLAMTECSRCHQLVATDAIACPHCGVTLKAYGHPGVLLYRAAAEQVLCETCTYDADDSCTFPQRPHAKECTLYHNRFQPTVLDLEYRPSLGSSITAWLRRNMFWVGLLVLLAVSVAIALKGR